MLAELIIGDAYGQGFEFANREWLHSHNKVEGYVRHHNARQYLGRFSGSAQMALGIAQMMIEGQYWTPLNIAEAFLHQFRRNRRYGMEKYIYNKLAESADASEFLKICDPIKAGSSFCIRACPIGLYPDLQTVINNAKMQTQVTHSGKSNTMAGIAAALLVHYALYRPECLSLYHFLTHLFPGVLILPWHQKRPVIGDGVEVVSAAVTAFHRNDSMKELLWDCVDIGGYPTRVAAIALAAGSVSAEYRQDLPESFYKGLEADEIGHIAGLDRELMKIVPN